MRLYYLTEQRWAEKILQELAFENRRIRFNAEGSVAMSTRATVTANTSEMKEFEGRGESTIAAIDSHKPARITPAGLSGVAVQNCT